jgi:hypothetical protein
VEYLNTALTSLFSLALAPLSALSPVWSVVVVSLIAGVVLAFVYGKISNQRALKRVKRGIAAGIFESVLFRHDLKTSLTAQASMLWGGVRYFALAIPPILVLLVPSLVILAQLNLRFGSRALAPGESTVVTVEVADEDSLFEAELAPSEGLLITPPLRDLENKQISWRVNTPLQAQSPSPTLNFLVAGARASYPLSVGTQPATLATELHTTALWQFLYPGGTVPGALRKHVQAISVTYPEQNLSLAGIETNWLVLFVCLSLVSGLVASKVIGIEI